MSNRGNTMHFRSLALLLATLFATAVACSKSQPTEKSLVPVSPTTTEFNVKVAAPCYSQYLSGMMFGYIAEPTETGYNPNIMLWCRSNVWTVTTSAEEISNLTGGGASDYVPICMVTDVPLTGMTDGTWA